MTQEYLNLVVAGLAGLIAGLGSLAAYYAATHQNRLTANGVASDWMRDLRAWASETVDVMVESAYICSGEILTPSSDEKGKALDRCRMRLSALIERGRFLLPNENGQDYGTHKPSAYRGLRHAALDPIVAADRILEGSAELHRFPDQKEALIGVRREFVSLIQQMLDPTSANKTVANILRSVHADRKDDPTLGGLLPDKTKLPPGAEGLLFIASMRYGSTKV